MAYRVHHMLAELASMLVTTISEYGHADAGTDSRSVYIASYTYDTNIEFRIPLDW